MDTNIDQMEFRQAMGHFATGITVMTTRDENGSPFGVTASSFSSLSLDPPLIQWSLSTASRSFPVFAAATKFAVNILSAEQEEISRNFCRPIDRFATVEWKEGLEGLPLIEGSLAWVECARERVVPAGDHSILIGRVLRTSMFERTPLLHWKGGYMPITPERAQGYGAR